MVKVLENYYPKMKFLKLEQTPNTKAVGILEAIDHAFQDFGLPGYKQRLVGFCSDGSSVMMGERRGVKRMLKDQGNAPWILPVWCYAHKLELAIKDAFKNTYMDTVVDVLQLIYYYYKGSAKRNKEAQDIADLMDEHFLIANWKIIIMQIMNYAEDVTNHAGDRAKANGIIAKMLQYKFIFKRGILQDILDCIQKRFENVLSEEQVYLACHVFDHKPEANDGTALHQYGVEDVRVIYDHFRPLLDPAGCDCVASLREWLELKLYVTRNMNHFRGVHPLAVWQRVSQEDVDQQKFKNILKIIHLTRIYPLSNASCERGFSTMKRIK